MSNCMCTCFDIAVSKLLLSREGLWMKTMYDWLLFSSNYCKELCEFEKNVQHLKQRLR